MAAGLDGPRGPSADEMSGLSAQSLLSASSLSYKMQPDLSLATQRNVQSNFFATNNPQPGSVAVCTLNTGSSFVDFAQSVLYVDITLTASGGTGTDFVGWGPNGSAMNILNRVMISSRSGTLIERIDNANVLASSRLFFEKSHDWVTQNGSMLGAGVTSVMLQSASGNPLTNTFRYALPCNLWSMALGGSDSIWPGAICSGLRVELLLAPSGQALVANTAALTVSYAISQIRLDLVCVQLSDFALKSLNQSAATSSLELLTRTVQTTTGTRSSTTLNLDSGRACSRALMSIWREHPGATGSSNWDNFKCMTIDDTHFPAEWQLRLGNCYFPNQSIRGNSQYQAPVELYATTMQALGKLASSAAAATDLATYRSDRFQIWQDLERQGGPLDGFGVPTSNSRLLNSNITFVGTLSPANVGSSLVFFFLVYSTLCRIYLSGVNCEV